MSNSCLYEGQVYHKRFRPRTHVLRYSVFSWLLDLDEIDQLTQRIWLFSRNRFNFFSFYDKDFGEIAGESLQDYIHRCLHQAGIQTLPNRVLLSAYPRVLGYTFNPLSLFYCLDEKGLCYAVIHEVHNTFGERHAYVLPVEQSEPVSRKTGNDVTDSDGNQWGNQLGDQWGDQWIEQGTDKELFVSPFADMQMTYRFRLNLPRQRQVIIIRASDDTGVLITASYVADRRMLNTSQLIKYFCQIPLLSAKVLLGIHWEALRLWVKGVPLFKHEPKQTT